MKKFVSLSAVAALSVCLATTPALADHHEEENYTKATWPLRINKRPLTLPKSMLEIRGDTFIVNLSADQVAKPVSIAPDLYFGVSNKLTVGVTHANGVCVTGTSGGCDKVYNDVGIDGLLALMGAGNLQLALHAGVQMLRLSEPFLAGINAGFLVRVRSGKIALVSDPRIYAGVTKREEAGNKESLYVPVWIRYQAGAQLNPFVRSGVEGPLSGFGDEMRIPVGVGVDYTLNNRLDAGFEFAFPKVNDNIDERALFVRVALRL